MRKHHQTIFAFITLTIYSIAILGLYVTALTQKSVIPQRTNRPRLTTHEHTINTNYSPIVLENKELHQVQISRGSNDVVKPLDEHELINSYVLSIAPKYNIDPYLVMSVIQQESRYNPKAKNGNCVGLMQVSMRWHAKRAAKLRVTNFYDPYSNILVGVDYLAELFAQYKDPRLVLMLYNMEHDTALKMYKNGKFSTYAKTILARAEAYKKGV